jgi:hypothetical protein
MNEDENLIREALARVYSPGPMVRILSHVLDMSPQEKSAPSEIESCATTAASQIIKATNRAALIRSS